MKLYLMRHGEAEDAGEDGDRARRLTERGRAAVRTTGKALSRMGVAPERIWSSPFPRASETAEIVAVALGGEIKVELREELSAGVDCVAIAKLVDAGKGKGDLMLVGHNPDLEDFAAFLIAGEGGAGVKMKKGSVCAIDCLVPLSPGKETLVGLWSAGAFLAKLID